MIQIQPNEVQFTAIRAQGPGGQNVNKVSNAVHLRFDLKASSLPVALQTRILALGNHHVTQDGVVMIKSQKFRSLEKNKAQALRRLQDLVDRAQVLTKPRHATRPTYRSIQKRLTQKARRSVVKASRVSKPMDSF